MRKTVFYILFFLLSGVEAQESFYVLYVKGDILYASSTDSIQRPLKEGDIVADDLKFQFSNKDSYAKVLSDRQGELYFCSQLAEVEVPSEWVLYMKDNVFPKTEYFATRGDDDATTKLFFKDHKLLKEKRIKVSYIPKDTLSGYNLVVTSSKQRYSEKLKLSPDGYLVLTDPVFNLEERQLEFNDLKTIVLTYYDSKSERVTEIESMHFEAVDVNVVSETIQFYKQQLTDKGLSSEAIDTTILNFLQDTYGIELNLEDLGID